jgi:hypothetical protein
VRRAGRSGAWRERAAARTTSAAADLWSELSARGRQLVERGEAGRRGTRKRSLPAVGFGFAALAAMFTAVSQDVMAVNFTTTDQNFKLYSNYLQGESAAGFLAQNKGNSGSSQVGVAELGIKTAKLSGLCAIATDTIPILGQKYSLLIIAGDTVQGTAFNGTSVPAGVSVDANGLLSGTSLANAISASNLFVNTTGLAGFGNKISGLNLGQSADTVAASAGFQSAGQPAGQWPSGQNPPQAGNFGLVADHLNVAGLTGDTYGINLQGQITLPNLKMKVVPGAQTQAVCDD